MESNSKQRTFLQKYYLLIIYSVFFVADCYFLFFRQFNYRYYTKPELSVCLFLWFMSNTAFNIRSSPQTLAVRLLMYLSISLMVLSDVCGIIINIFTFSAFLVLYTITYLVYCALIVYLVKNAPKLEKANKFVINLKYSIPAFILTIGLGFFILYVVHGLGTDVANYLFYVHIFVVSILVSLVANMWSIKNVTPIATIFSVAMLFLLFTNIIYAFDKLYYGHRHTILDIFVAINNGLYQILLIFGVIKYLRLKRG